MRGRQKDRQLTPAARRSVWGSTRQGRSEEAASEEGQGRYGWYDEGPSEQGRYGEGPASHAVQLWRCTRQIGRALDTWVVTSGRRGMIPSASRRGRPKEDAHSQRASAGPARACAADACSWGGSHRGDVRVPAVVQRLGLLAGGQLGVDLRRGRAGIAQQCAPGTTAACLRGLLCSAGFGQFWWGSVTTV
jgi:hypothetical protein